jgi:PAS domain S-box-containing protein
MVIKMRRLVPDELMNSPVSWRVGVLKPMLRVTVVVGSLAYVPSVLAALRSRLFGVAWFDTFALATLIGLMMADRLPFRRRAATFCAAFYLIAFGLLIEVGPIGRIYLLAFSVVTTLLLGLRAGLLSSLLNSATLFAVGVLDRAAPEMLPQVWGPAFGGWVVVALNFTVVNTLLAVALGLVLTTLDHALDREISARVSLERERGLLRKLIDALPDVVFTKDTAGRYVVCNAAALAQVGLEREDQLAGKTVFDVFPGDIAQNQHARDLDVLSGKPLRNFEEQGLGTPAHPVRYLTIKIPLLGADGSIAGLINISRDITEQKLAVAALQHSEERLRLITNLVPHGIFAKDSAGRHIFANTALAELSGMSVDEILGKTDYDLVANRAEAEAYRADDVAVIRSGKKMVISEEPRTDLTGRTRLLQTIKIPFTVVETGEPAVLGVCMDITERKRADARFRWLVDSNVQGVFFWNTNGKITGANDAFLRTVGYTRDDLDSGRIGWAKMTPPESLDQEHRALKALAETGVCEPYEREYFRQDRSRVPVFVGPAMFEDDRNEGFCFVLDLTESKKLEQRFLRAQRMESIGTLAGGIAHDLNNILAPILMAIDILKARYDNPGAKTILETIEVSAKRGADVVRQVLSFARGLEGQRVEIQTKHLFHEFEKLVQDTFPKDIELRFSVPSDVWTILGDPTQVHQILLNLCVNARDAMPNGGSLTIGVENFMLDEQFVAMTPNAKPGRHIRICVTDTGTGIPPAIINRIFEPFFTTKEVSKGTGLGLSTVMAIIKSHEGVVNVSSETDKGTTFSVYLPAANAAFEASKERRDQPIMPRGNGETVLVIDDEASIREIAREILQSFGFRVLTAKNGTEGAAVYSERRNEIAVVVTDMMMPSMGGVDVIRVLRRINPAVKIVASSGFVGINSGNGLSDAGVRHFLSKPYSAETLLRTVWEISQSVQSP